METLILSTDKDHLLGTIEIAKEVLSAGDLVAFPTETVYGLGGNGLNPEASKKIYAAKGRPSDNPLILHIGNMTQLTPLVKSVPEKAKRLAEAFWPGPLTMIFEKADIVPAETSGGLSTVAVRMPSHPVAHALLEALDFPVAAPSANLSGRPSPTRVSHVIEDMRGRIPCIMDGGDVEIGVESTIVDLTSDIPMLLRPGWITLSDLQGVIGEVQVDPAIENRNIIHHTIEVGHPKAPGMKYRHYAPKASVTVVYGDDEEVIRSFQKAARRDTGILTVEEHVHCFPTGVVISCGTGKDPGSIAHGLFDALRQFDEEGVSEIFSEDFTKIDRGTAIMNRLLKAAGGHYISAGEFLKSREEKAEAVGEKK